MQRTSKIRVKEGSCNVFADLGFPNPEREQLKARFTLQIYRLIKDRGLTQAEAGTVLGIKQPHVSTLMRDQSGAFSVERLMDFLTPGPGCRNDAAACTKGTWDSLGRDCGVSESQAQFGLPVPRPHICQGRPIHDCMSDWTSMPLSSGRAVAPAAK